MEHTALTLLAALSAITLSNKSTVCLPLLVVSIVGIDVLTPVLDTLTGKHAALMLLNSKLRSNPCHLDFAAVS